MASRQVCLAGAVVLLCASLSHAENAPKTASLARAKVSAEGQKGSPSSLIILFAEGSSKLSPTDASTLDKASRAYNEGKPIVMIVTGSADRSGSSQQNLKLSQQRANAVLRGLLDRGIPAERFQVLAKGETELPVPTPRGVAERENRRVVISWH